MKPSKFLAGLLAVALYGQQSPIKPEHLRGHLAFLADDLLEGRGMGQRGGELTVRYLESQFRTLGLRPANGDSYLQPVQLVGMKPKIEESLCTFSSSKGILDLKLGKDFYLAPTGPQNQFKLDAELIFVGHGTVSPQGIWDDYKGVDVEGKLLVMLMGQRANETTASPCCSPDHYLGRWSHKVGEGIRRGAAGVLIIHTSESAGYDWSVAGTGWRCERFALANNKGKTILAGMIQREAAQKLIAASGQDLEALIARAQRRDFCPVAIDMKGFGTVRSEIRHLVQHNVAGWLPGTGVPQKDEFIVYSAHWDHFGRQEDGKIYNGAVDNASGLAALLAIAQAAVRNPTLRSQLFISFTGEESGLLGSTAYVSTPLRPLARTAAVLNLESLNFLGETRDIAALGADVSDLGDYSRMVAASMGLSFRGSASDPAALFFRADHFPFVRAGIPAISPGFSLNGGWNYVHDPVGSQAKALAWLREGYHKSSDRYDPAWSLDGMAQQARFVFELGQLVGNAPRKPQWLKDAPLFIRHP